MIKFTKKLFKETKAKQNKPYRPNEYDLDNISWLFSNVILYASEKGRALNCNNFLFIPNIDNTKCKKILIIDGLKSLEIYEYFGDYYRYKNGSWDERLEETIQELKKKTVDMKLKIIQDEEKEEQEILNHFNNMFKKD